MTQFSEWVKRLGQQHWSIPGSSVTLCGMPMLGNNYAQHMSDKDKHPCKECAAERARLEEEDAHH